MVLKARPRHAAPAPVAARHGVLIYISIAAAILPGATGCWLMEPVDGTGRPISTDYRSRCPDNLVETYPLWYESDFDDWNEGREYKIRCVSAAEAATRAAFPSEMEMHWNDEATRAAKLDEEYRREKEEAHKDAIRSCILAGNHPNLCELDPYDPYGTDPQQ